MVAGGGKRALEPVSADSPLLSIIGIQKRFPNGTVALRGVDITVHSGTVHGLVGANGAGKSTLVKVLSGAMSPTAGELRWKGETVVWADPRSAQTAGVATVYQHIPLVPKLSVLENVCMSDTGMFRTTRAMRRRLYQTMQMIDYEIDPSILVEDLSIGERQMVAILQALESGAELIIFDEPTASLSRGERDLVLAAMRHLANRGKTLIFVSHLLEEVMSSTDWITTLRDGQVVLDAPTRSLTSDQLITAIVGKTLLAIEHRTDTPIRRMERPVVILEKVSSANGLVNVSFSVYRGEILGLAGLMGSGRSEILRAIFGDDSSITGTITVDGRAGPRNTSEAVAAGLALVPEDRMKEGLIDDWEIWRNVTLPYLPEVSTIGGVPDPSLEHQRGRHAIESMSIVAPNDTTPVRELSGGNAQKVVFAKWLSGSPRLFLLDEPTAGIDVGAKADILQEVRRLASDGNSIIVVSSEFAELLAICDRVLVVRNGEVVAERMVADTDEHELLALASGLKEIV